MALLDGWHLLHDAVAADIDVSHVALVSPGRDPDAHALLEQLPASCEIVRVTPAVMNVLSPVRTPSGVVALAHKRLQPMRALWDRVPALILIAVDVQDPGNAGAIVRAGEAAGASGILFAGTSADPWSWKALRASMGSTFRVPVARTRHLSDASDELRRAGIVVAAAVPRAGTPMHELNLRRPTALLLGGEGAGLDATVAAAADARVTIPMHAPVESLNVAIAAAVLAYEAKRQRDLG